MLAQQLQPDVVLMGIHMQRVDGFAACEHIVGTVPYVQVLSKSVPNSEEWLRRALLSGARGHLTKPFTMDDCVSEIRRAHALSAASRRAAAAEAESGHAFPKEEREVLARAIETIQEYLDRQGET